LPGTRAIDVRVCSDQAEIGVRRGLQGGIGAVVVDMRGWIWYIQGVEFTVGGGFLGERAFVFAIPNAGG